jgi:hypothetical protein
MGRGRPAHLRVAMGVGAFFLADLITGLIAFSVITLGALWYFSYSWIQLASAYQAQDRAFGTPLQLGLAWVGVLVDLPLLVAAVFFGIRAYRLPVRAMGIARGQ